MKEINQRNEDSVLIQCSCSGYHFLELSYWVWENENFKEFMIAIVSPPADFWYRVKKAITYIIKGDNLYISDVTVTEKDLHKIVELINKYKKLK